jgi:small-conductance mechanosensitive channel
VFDWRGRRCSGARSGETVFDWLEIENWLKDAGEVLSSRETLQLLLLQLGIIAGVFMLALALRLVTKPFTTRLCARFARYVPASWLAGNPRRLMMLSYAWVLLVIARNAGERLGHDWRLVAIAGTLTALWVLLRASSLLFRDALFARLVAIAAWSIAALDVTGLLSPTIGVLDAAALNIGTVRLSLLLVVKAALLIAAMLWAALALARLVSTRIQHLALSPSVQTLASNLIRIALVFLALLIGLNTVGIDLTGVAVFSGAIGVGVGLGLQKIVSNFISGIILLLERSVKPGDVIEVGHTHGAITSLGARYTSVRGRDGKEYLIPNEWFITNQVVNWSYSSSLVRLDIAFGVGYGSDLRQVRQLAIEAAAETKRVVATPAPVCHITEFADNGVNLLLRFWIEDPASGVTNIKGDVFLGLWDRFKEHEIELPFPQRDIRLRDVPVELLHPAAIKAAAD